MDSTGPASRVGIDWVEAQVTAGQRMAGAEETDADRALGRRDLAGELTADEAIAIRLAQIDRAHGITR
ncbi:antitoxin VbhA family protein [Propioniciclava flava]|uniref:Antitoxin VbhA domain-containing protein n=1 Tax=Propioniciclava flava TaxID=2072026 RepID=A0A4Q2ELS6_9ACTN|nr:antitoxin VbhA family protein [Propioniciclava flava]RXW33534.1 hypothetical protein C1706_01920 [Propioniciclava flava]